MNRLDRTVETTETLDDNEPIVVRHYPWCDLKEHRAMFATFGPDTCIGGRWDSDSGVHVQAEIIGDDPDEVSIEVGTGDAHVSLTPVDALILATALIYVVESVTTGDDPSHTTLVALGQVWRRLIGPDTSKPPAAD